MTDAPAMPPATFASLGERGLIRRLRAALPSRADVLVGAGLLLAGGGRRSLV